MKRGVVPCAGNRDYRATSADGITGVRCFVVLDLIDRLMVRFFLKASYHVSVLIKLLPDTPFLVGYFRIEVLLQAATVILLILERTA